jgi:hypothetical protein
MVYIIPNSIVIIPNFLYFICLDNSPLELKEREDAKNKNNPQYNAVRRIFFSTDEKLVYRPFSLDFGPLNISCVYRFCKYVNDLKNDRINLDAEIGISNKDERAKHFYYFTSFDPFKRANAIFLLSSYLLYYGFHLDNNVKTSKFSDEEMFEQHMLNVNNVFLDKITKIFSSLYPPIPPFRDASSGLNTF